MRRLLPLAAVLAAVATAPPAAVAQDQDPGCHDYVPPRAPEPVTGRALNRIEVRVLVLLGDRLTAEQVAPTMALVADSYDRVGVDLKVAQYQPADLKATDGPGAIEEARTLVGGKRPPWAHLVLALSRKGHNSGHADCVGGIRNDRQAFAMADFVPPGQGTGLVSVYPDNGARLITHELGHLLGAHHHHSTCVEGLTDPAPPGETAPCSVMWNGLTGQGRHFGAVEAAHVRMYAEDFVKPLPPVPTTPPPAQPTPVAGPAPVDTAPPAAPAQTPRKRPSAACRRAKAAATAARRRLAAARGERRAPARRRLAAARRVVARRC